MENRIVHSEPVREIMGTPPRKLVAWGTTALLAIFMLFAVAAWYIRYPDVIPATVQITTRIPPVTLYARASGRLVILNVADRQHVTEGDLLAVLESDADHIALLRLEKLLSESGSSPDIDPLTYSPMGNLGKVQEPFNTYILALSRIRNYRSNDYLGSKILALKAEISTGEKYISGLQTKELLYGEDLKLQQSAFRRDSLLFVSGAITHAAFEQSKQNLLARRIELQQTGIEILSEQISLDRRRQEMNDLMIKREEELQNLSGELLAGYSRVVAAIAGWKTDYLFTSPVNGTVIFTRLLVKEQYVADNESVMTIIPDNSGEPVGRINISMNRSGKVNVGMAVNIKLDGYPFLEYGSVRGVVTSVSPVADGSGYLTEISLPDGLVTSYGDTLTLSQNMSGKAEIITDNLSLLQKIIDPFRYLLARNRSVSKLNGL